MCRWLAYSGSPVLIEELLYKPAHALIDQSLHSRLGVETSNGEGFGIGWYGQAGTPAVFRNNGRGEALGLPVLERARLAVALLQHRARDPPRDLSGERDVPRARCRVAAGRLGAPRRPPRRLERGSRVQLRRRAAGSRRVARVRACRARLAQLALVDPE